MAIFLISAQPSPGVHLRCTCSGCRIEQCEHSKLLAVLHWQSGEICVVTRVIDAFPSRFHVHGTSLDLPVTMQSHGCMTECTVTGMSMHSKQMPGRLGVGTHTSLAKLPPSKPKQVSRGTRQATIDLQCWTKLPVASR